MAGVRMKALTGQSQQLGTNMAQGLALGHTTELGDVHPRLPDLLFLC